MAPVHGPIVLGVASTSKGPKRGATMFYSLFLILFIVFFAAWILAWLAFHVAGGLIHLLLVVAIISLIVHFARGRP